MADFQDRIADFEAQKVTVIGASVDALEYSQRTLARHKLTFPLAYGVNAKEVSSLTGAFYDAEKGYLHATGSLIQPDGRVAVAVYSTGAIGRFMAADCLGMIDHLSKKTE